LLVVTATAFRPAQLVTAKVELDIRNCGVTCTSLAEIAQFLVFVLKCSVAVTAVAVAD
jgi:hypothetical protein